MPLDNNTILAIKRKFIGWVSTEARPSMSDICDEFDLTDKEKQRINLLCAKERWNDQRRQGIAKAKENIISKASELAHVNVDFLEITRNNIASRFHVNNQIASIVDQRLMDRLMDSDAVLPVGMLLEIKKLTNKENSALVADMHKFVQLFKETKDLPDTNKNKHNDSSDSHIEGDDDDESEAPLATEVVYELGTLNSMWRRAAIILDNIDTSMEVPKDDRAAVSDDEKKSIFELLQDDSQ